MGPEGAAVSGTGDERESAAWHLFNEPSVLPARDALACRQAAVDACIASGEPAFALWRAGRALLVTGAETCLPHFAAAAASLKAAGWPVLARTSGGSACPVAPGTLQAAMILPAPRGTDLDMVYGALVAPIVRALAAFGIAARAGPAPRAYCPGRYDILVGGRKIAGTAQHWRQHAGGWVIAAGASLVIDESPAALAATVNRFHALAGDARRCDPDAVTSLARAAGRAEGRREELVAEFTDRLAETVRRFPPLAHAVPRA